MIVLQMNLPLPMLLPLRDKLIQDKQLVLPHQSNRPVIFPPPVYNRSHHTCQTLIAYDLKEKSSIDKQGFLLSIRHSLTQLPPLQLVLRFVKGFVLVQDPSLMLLDSVQRRRKCFHIYMNYPRYTCTRFSVRSRIGN
jgi:hypothetical protein